MQTLSRALQSRDGEGKALPVVFPTLEAMGARFRTGQLVLIASGPGGGKSAFATTLALRSKVPTLYLSPDSDRTTLGTRIAGSLTGDKVRDVEEALYTGKGAKFFDAIVSNTAHIRFSFDAGPTLDDIDEEVMCYERVHGRYPQLMVVDNLKDCYVEENGDGGEHVRYGRVIDYLHELTRLTGMCVVILHHLTGRYEDGEEPAPLSALLGKVGKTPRLILTIHRPDEFHMGVSIVKNSNGRMDPSGYFNTLIPYDRETQILGGL
ncbi:hypothetical protein Lfu02_17520 [Longispora fulva]|uniref:SF4 helicase domain-containing protein n=1 Tax=Longispora fulva TaxID=619741 RepID=A0A8J7KNG7_9ACTN|nr:DnaB-like helicase C-terminal domain-containing protein [Longispora fulva]MBG6140241.1 hypothetical protein [Longispora fulva]GIG57380.1 hypothetical protein Lfu02_17520 [Longispora fulva]